MNIAARLEAETKTFECTLVISAEAADAAGVDLSRFPRRTARVRGRGHPIDVFAIEDVSEIPGFGNTSPGR